MQMYKVMMLPLAEEDIMNNTDYIAFEKKAPETALELAMGFRNTIAKLEFMPKQHELDEDEELAAREIPILPPCLVILPVMSSTLSLSRSRSIS